jgi:hypothetical protein
MDDQLKQLFDYTKFHIGMYVTLLAATIGWFAKNPLDPLDSEIIRYVQASVVCFVVAGMAGGLVASSIPYFTRFEDFKKAKLGPGKFEFIPAIFCTYIEHFFFWIGVFVAVGGFLITVH